MQQYMLIKELSCIVRKIDTDGSGSIAWFSRWCSGELVPFYSELIAGLRRESTLYWDGDRYIRDRITFKEQPCSSTL